jgi:glycosyltransferase involved in cell wall biosynthesis
MIIGDGPLRAPLEALACGSGEAASIRFLGAQPHPVVTAWMRRATLFCLPSRRAANGQEEALGLVLLEAASCGLPVVATRSGGIAEAVADGRTGLLVRPCRPDALAEAIIHLLDMPDRAHAMGQVGRQRAIAEFDLHEQTRRLEAVYWQAIKDAADGKAGR